MTPNRKLIITTIAAIIMVLLTVFAFTPPGRSVLGDMEGGLRGGLELDEAARNPQYAKKERTLRALGIPTKISELYDAAVPRSQNAIIEYADLASDKSFPTSKDELAAIKICSSTAPASDSDWLAARRLLATQPKLISVAEAAVRKPFCVPSLPDDDAEPAAIKFPEYAGIRRATRIITIRTMLLAQDGRFKEAVLEQSFGFQAAEHAKRDRGVMIASLVGIACEAITLSGMKNVLRASHGDPAVAQSVDGAVEKGWKPSNPAIGISHETAFGNSEIHYIGLHGPDSLAALENSSGDEESADNGKADDDKVTVPFAIRSRWKPFIDLDGTFYLDLMDRAISASRLAYPQNVHELDKLDKDVSTKDPIKCLLAAFLYPSGQGYCRKCVQISSQAAIARAACAVFVYKSKHGAYPTTLADAAPTAIDPFDDKLLGYRREGNGFVIYSVGPTGRYDGGDYDKKKQHEEVFRY